MPDYFIAYEHLIISLVLKCIYHRVSYMTLQSASKNVMYSNMVLKSMHKLFIWAHTTTTVLLYALCCCQLQIFHCVVIKVFLCIPRASSAHCLIDSWRAEKGIMGEMSTQRGSLGNPSQTRWILTSSSLLSIYKTLCAWAQPLAHEVICQRQME